MGKQSIGTAQFPLHSSISCIGFWKEVNSLLQSSNKVATTFTAHANTVLFQSLTTIAETVTWGNAVAADKISRPHFAAGTPCFPCGGALFARHSGHGRPHSERPCVGVVTLRKHDTALSFITKHFLIFTISQRPWQEALSSHSLQNQVAFHLHHHHHHHVYSTFQQFNVIYM